MKRSAAAGLCRCASMPRAKRWAPRCFAWRSRRNRTATVKERPMLDVRREGRLLRLTLNRPEKRNALNIALCNQLESAIEAGNADPGVGAILLAGAGKSFCAGMDLKEMESGIEEAHERLFTIGRRVTTPILAAVHGAAVAGGTGLVANAHIVIASGAPTFGLTGIPLAPCAFVLFPPFPP